ncbi:MAG: type II toxin-antitoxin system prevent-host-death family antitoxin [Dietzia sp.]|nr:type II toxin-antitoxin system prevent-host-death family antitoxin [Dietzia sp.]
MVDTVDEVGLRELREHADELASRAKGGEEITITVAGRPIAKLVPAIVRTHTWRQWSDVAEVFTGPADHAWATDRDYIAHDIRDGFQ